MISNIIAALFGIVAFYGAIIACTSQWYKKQDKKVKTTKSNEQGLFNKFDKVVVEKENEDKYKEIVKDLGQTFK